MEKKRLILDFDSTIVNTTKAYCDTYNVLFSDIEGFKPADWTKSKQWDLADECPLALPVSKGMFGLKVLFDNLEFFPDADRVINELTRKYDIAICSIGTYHNIYHKAEWIRKNMPYIEKSILLCNQNVKMDKSVVDMSGAIFIDDNKNCLDSSNAETKICYGEILQWNESWKGYRLNNWDSVGFSLV